MGDLDRGLLCHASCVILVLPLSIDTALFPLAKLLSHRLLALAAKMRGDARNYAAIDLPMMLVHKLPHVGLQLAHLSNAERTP